MCVGVCVLPPCLLLEFVLFSSTCSIQFVVHFVVLLCYLIVCTLNIETGALGFLATGGASSDIHGNYG